ncbi:oxygenase MpaB family protein [Streptacidiphilus sp. PAMC 29251]
MSSLPSLSALPGLPYVRAQLGRALFERVAGPTGPDTRSRIHDTPGPRWFAADRPIRTVHGDASMFVGGLAALLLQSLHPLAMAAVAAHSGYRSDPWGRLQRTSTFLATTTFGTAADAESVTERVRAVHEKVRGTTDEGRPYHASDPHLLEWVHVAEVDSFLRAHQRYGAAPLDRAGCDGYVADTAEIAERLGVSDPPRTVAELAARLADYRPELQATRGSREATRFLLLHPPLPVVALPAYAGLAAAATDLLPRWARQPLGLPGWPVEAVAAPIVGQAVIRTIRWAMRPPSDEAGPDVDPAQASV